MCNFACDSTGFSRGFPGVHPHLLTLNSNFTIPFYREFLLFLGVCSVSKRSCERILRKGKGSAIAIVVGGAAESLSAHPGTADLTLRKRCVLFSLCESIWNRLVDVFPDWGSLNSPFARGKSYAIWCTDSGLIFRFAARILSLYFHSARMTYVLSNAEFYLCLMRRSRFTSKCQTKKARRYIKFRRNFKMYLALRFHYSMGEGYSTVGFHRYLPTIRQTDGSTR